jgi:hypothetical protein
MAKAIDRVTDVLPQYDQVIALFAKMPHSKDRLQTSIGKVYADLLQFCHNLMRVFKKADGSQS